MIERPRPATLLMLPVLLAMSSPVAAAGLAAAAAPLGSPETAAEGLSLNASGEVLYDSNLLRTTDAALLIGNRHRDDFRYSPSGSAKFSRNVGRWTVSVGGLVGHDFFQYNSYLNRNRFAADGLFTFRAGSSCQAVVSGNYSNRQSGLRGDSLATSDPTGNPDSVGKIIDSVQESALYGINANCAAPGGGLSFGGGYNRASIRNGAAIRKFSDSDSNTFSGNLGIGILRPGQVSLTGSYSTINYPGRAFGVPGGFVPPQLATSGVHTYRIGVTLSRPFGTRLNGTLGVSYLHADPSGGQAPYSSPAYNVAVYYRSSPRLSFGLVGVRDVVSSSTAAALYRVIDQIQLSSQYSLGQSITVGANFGLIRNDFKQPFALGGEPLRRRETSKTAGFNVTFAPRALFDVRLGVNQTIRSSDPSIYNYNSTKASLTLAVHI